MESIQIFWRASRSYKKGKKPCRKNPFITVIILSKNSKNCHEDNVLFFHKLFFMETSSLLICKDLPSLTIKKQLKAWNVAWF